MIATSRLAPGAPLPTERELAATYSVGRSSVREALRILESQGVVAQAVGGTLVVAAAPRPLTRSLRLVMALAPAADTGALFELRGIIEVDAARLAAQRREPQHLEEMRAAVAEMADALAGAQPARYIAADVRFHLAIADATGNRLIAACMEAIRENLQEALAAIFEIPGSPERAVDEHRAIADAIEAGDAERAAAAARAHLDRVEADLEQAR